jgi:Beta-lactamase
MPDLHAAAGTSIDWPVEHAAAAVTTADGTVAATAGEWDRHFELASVTKLLAAYALLVAVDAGEVDWCTPAGPQGSTVRHLAAHTSGLAMVEAKVLAKPGTKRICSTSGSMSSAIPSRRTSACRSANTCKKRCSRRSG